MPNIYDVAASQSTVQQLTPTVSVDSVATTITTKSGVTATLVLPETWYASGEAQQRLAVFSEAIDEVMNTGHVAAAVAGQSIDDNGLLQDVIDFTVVYPGRNQPGPLLTRVVEVACSNIGG